MASADDGPDPGLLNPTLAQIALCTNDIPRSVELFTEALGFIVTRADVMSGPWLARVQELGQDGSMVVFWLIDGQEFFQLEVVHHFDPKQRPQPADWKPSDLGWVRWGMQVEDIEGCVRRLTDRGVSTFTTIRDFGDLGRRVAFRDPYVGVIVELMEKAGPRLALERDEPPPPSVRYVTLSVPNLESARAYWIGAMGLVETDPSVLHSPQMEALWGLDGASQRSFLARAGDRCFEIVEYQSPRGRPPPKGHLLSDQGIMNPSVGYRDRDLLDACVGRLAAVGSTLSAPLSPKGLPAGAYVRTPDGASVEMYSVDPKYNAISGFTPAKREETAAGMAEMLKNSVKAK